MSTAARPPGRPPTRAALARSVHDVARGLLGAVVVHDTPEGRVAVRLTEVEAYAGTTDPGSHAYRGPTPRTQVMFGEPGHWYVYFTYGMHWCVNLVCEPAGGAAAVLLRAGDVVDGAELARQRRPAARRDVELASGPARLTTALGVDGGLTGADALGGSPLTLLAAPVDRSAEALSGPRVGVAGAGATSPWRFWLPDEPSVSRYRAAAGRPRRGSSSP